METLGVLRINDETLGRKVASNDNANRRQRTCKYKRAAQAGGGKIESHEYNIQVVDIKKQYNADNEDKTTESCINERQDVNVQEQYNTDNVAK